MRACGWMRRESYVRERLTHAALVPAINARKCRPNASKLEVFTVPTSRIALSAAVDEFLESLPRTTVLDRINDTLASSTFWHARVTTKLVCVLHACLDFRCSTHHMLQRAARFAGHVA